MSISNTQISLPRRSLLTGSASALAAIGMATWARGSLAQTAAAPKPLPAYVGWKDPASVIVHSSTTIETKRSAFGQCDHTCRAALYSQQSTRA